MDSICYCYLLCASIFKVLKLSRIKNMYIIGIASDHSLTEQESLYRSSVVFFFKRESIVIFYVVREFTGPSAMDELNQINQTADWIIV